MTGINFTKSCVALPDIKERLDRNIYASDKDQWLSEGLTREDVDILRRRAADLDRAGYMSMTPGSFKFLVQHGVLLKIE